MIVPMMMFLAFIGTMAAIWLFPKWTFTLVIASTVFITLIKVTGV